MTNPHPLQHVCPTCGTPYLFALKAAACRLRHAAVMAVTEPPKRAAYEAHRRRYREIHPLEMMDDHSTATRTAARLTVVPQPESER